MGARHPGLSKQLLTTSYINSHDIIADYLRKLGRGPEGRDQGHYIHAGQGGQGVGDGGRGQGGTQEGFDVI